MNKITISGIVIGVSLIAVGFAIQPMQQAQAVHTGIQASTTRHFTLTGTVSPDTGVDDAVDEALLFTINQPFVIQAVSLTFTADTGANCDLDSSNVRTNIVPETGIAEIDPGVINSVTDTRVLVDNTAIAVAAGTTVLEIALVETGGCDADSRATVNAIIETTGALTAAPAGANQVTSAAKANGLAGD